MHSSNESEDVDLPIKSIFPHERHGALRKFHSGHWGGSTVGKPMQAFVARLIVRPSADRDDCFRIRKHLFNINELLILTAFNIRLEIPRFKGTIF